MDEEQTTVNDIEHVSANKKPTQDQRHGAVKIYSKEEINEYMRQRNMVKDPMELV